MVIVVFSLEKNHINESHLHRKPRVKRTPGKHLRVQTIKTSNDLHSLFTEVAQD